MAEIHNNPKRIGIDDLVLEPGPRRLFRDDHPIELPKLSFDLLLAMVEAAPNVVHTDDLLRAVWGEVMVSDETLTQRVKMLRDALDETGDKQRYIETVRGVGYRLKPEIASLDVEPAPQLSNRQTRRPGNRNIAIAFAVVAVLAVVLWFAGESLFGTGTDAPAKGSIAVLPFAAMSNGLDDGYFADGLTEEILNSLTQVPELLVTARTSAFYFKGKDLPVQDIAATLGVAHIVEGSVRRDRDQLRITAQLVRAEDGFHVWSDTFDRTSEDIFAVQIDIAERVAAALGIVLDDALRAKMQNTGLRDPEAFIAYQKGVELFDRAHGSDRILELLAEANTHFEYAIERAPEFATSYVQHSDYYVHVLLFEAAGRHIDGYSDTDLLRAGELLLKDLDEAIRVARDPAQREIIALDRAIVGGNWVGLGAQVNNVLEKPVCDKSIWLETVAFPFGAATASNPLIIQWVECDPLDFSTNVHLNRMLFWQGKFDAALKASTRALQIVDHPSFRISRALALIGMDELDELETLIAQSPDDYVMTLGASFWLAAHRGDAATARAALARSRDVFGSTPGDLLAYHAVIGDRDVANRIAADADTNPFGYMVLLNSITTCYCGAPFDLEAAPNFARRLRESGLAWPPTSPFEWPLKTW